MPKRRGRPRKNKNSKHSLATVFILLLVLGSFSFGVFLGFKKRVVAKNIMHESKQAASKMFNVQPVLPTASINVPILVYHYVEFVKDSKDTIRKSLDIIPPIFEAQIKTLKDFGYNFITASELGQYLDGKKQLPQRPVILTFDDGYADFYTDVFPILKKYNVAATEYVVSGFLDTPNYMTTEQVKEIAQSGLVEIGAHTVHHLNLKSLPLEHAKKEIEQSKEDLEQLLGIKVVSFAYPYGGFNEHLAELVKNAGFTTGVTTKGGSIVNQENKFTLFRVHPGASVGESLIHELGAKY